jgi:polysaccharide export outer membrane protein
MRLFWQALCTALLVAACGEPPPANYANATVESTPTELGEGDRIHLRVFYGSQSMQQEYTLGEDGTIAIQFIGEVVATGKTKNQLEKEIRDKLADGYLKDPIVAIDVKLSLSKKLSVFGEVSKPGSVVYSPGMSIVEVLSEVGGFTPLAKKNDVKVTRVEGSEKRRYNVPVEAIAESKAEMFLVQPGDVVFVPRRGW